MKKQFIMLLFVSLAISGPLEAQQTRWQLLKSRLDRELKELKECVKGRKNCDPERKKFYIAAGAIIALLAGLGIKKGMSYFTRTSETSVEVPKKLVVWREEMKAKAALREQEERERKEHEERRRQEVEAEKIQKALEERKRQEVEEERQKAAQGKAVEPKEQIRKLRLGEKQEEEEGSESEYYSAPEDSGGEGYVSASDEPYVSSKEEELNKQIAKYRAHYLDQMGLLEEAKFAGRSLKPIETTEFNKITARQKSAGNIFLQADEEENLETKLNLLKKAFDVLRGR